MFDLRSQLQYTSDFLTNKHFKECRSQVKGPADFDLDSVSPLLQVDRLKVPVLLVHGDDDSTVPVAQSRRYDAALTRRGKPHEFHVIKDEGHGFREKGSLAFYLEKLDAFLAKHNPAD